MWWRFFHFLNLLNSVHHLQIPPFCSFTWSCSIHRTFCLLFPEVSSIPDFKWDFGPALFESHMRVIQLKVFGVYELGLERKDQLCEMSSLWNDGSTVWRESHSDQTPSQRCEQMVAVILSPSEHKSFRNKAGLTSPLIIMFGLGSSAC